LKGGVCLRADRLLMVLSLLQTHGRIASRELAKQLEVSERTVHRDMEALSIAGIPVYAERGSRGGWTLSEGYRNQMTGMTTDEIRSLLLLHSSSVVRDLGLQEQVQTAFRKLLTALPSSKQQDAEYARQRIHVDGAGWHSSPHSDTALLPIVQQAVWEQQKLHITYSGWDSDSDKASIVCPLGIVAKMRVWYMVAQTEEGIRTYRISRLKEAVNLNDPFTRPDPFDLAAYWGQSTAAFKSNLPTYAAQIRIASTMWSKFTRERYVYIHNNMSVNEGAWMEASVDFQTIESAVGILLSYGRCAKALAPEQLCQAVVEEIHAMIPYYEDKDMSSTTGQ
jgi:predicted DNA-binding transcriptional regulator YafY